MAITSKEINLTQLGIELGNRGLCADFNDPKKKIIIPAEGENISDEELENAIANHVAEPTSAEITELNKNQALAKLKELGFTDEQISALLNL